MKILTSWLRSYLPALDVDDHQLAEDLTLRGIAVEGVFAAGDRSVFDMDITTNRVDAMNHYGIAREAAAIYNVPLLPLGIELPSTPPSATPFAVRIEAPERCGRFTARVIRGVKVGPSAGLVSRYFEALGQKQISNAVDATNFVLLGMGQPTHAFDLDKVAGSIVVRQARKGEQIRLLDGTTRTLSVDDLVVADEVKALGLAGIMGGWDSMITAETTNVLVEAAWFEPAGIRASSRRHALHTDASHRFERGVDFAAAPIANGLVSGQIVAACGGTVEGDLIDVVIPSQRSAVLDRLPIRLSGKRVQRLLGTTVAPAGIQPELMRRYLTALGCGLHSLDDDTWEVTLPPWRLDLTRPVDLAEEIARVYGYNGFANTLPTAGVTVAHPLERKLKAIRAAMFQLGYSEAISSTFASAAETEVFAPESAAVALENPLQEEAANLRPSLLPGMITMVAHNLNRDVLTVRLFEAGGVFRSSAEEVVETESLALGLTGFVPATAIHSAQDAPFFELKGALEALLALFETSAPVYRTDDVPAAFETRRAAIVLLGQQQIASFGQLAQSVATEHKLRQPVYVAEVKLSSLLALPLKHTMAQELSRFQAVERDFSFTFAEGTQWKAVAGAIRKLGIPELRSVNVVEVFRDAKKLPGHFSMLVRLVFQSSDRTLVEGELAAWSGAVIEALQSLGGSLRG